MSKVDALRALREARYEAARKGTRPARQASVARAALEQASGDTKSVARRKARQEKTTEPEICGHTAISGKRCIRPAGHTEKTHRYPKA